MALVAETKKEAQKKTATKHKAAAAPAKESKGEKKDKKSKKDKAPEKWDGTVPMALRGVIKSSAPKGKAQKKQRLGGDMTNAEYAKEKGITPRQASKIRSGKKKAE